MSMIQITVANNMKRNTVIAPDTSTLRDVLESNGIDYSRGMTTLDGATLQPGDLDKTFAAFGITSRCSLFNVVKTDNAAKVVIAGNAAVVTSGVPFEDFKLLEKYRPSALTLYEGEGEERRPVFMVATGETGSINEYGAVLTKAPADENKAQITLIFDAVPEEQSVEEYISDKIGRALLNLDKVEQTIPAVKTEVEAEKAMIGSFITLA